MAQIYTWNLKAVAAIVVCVPIIWGAIAAFLHKQRVVCIVLNGIISILSIYGVLVFCVLGRVPGDTRTFAVFSAYHSELYRELIMNIFLYVPFGLSVPFLLKYRMGSKLLMTTAIAFLLSFCIEYWQYIQGTGVAQVSDVLMNTLGGAIGAMAYPISNLLSYIGKRGKES